MEKSQTQMPFAVKNEIKAPQWPPIERTVVDSTSLVSMGYDPKTRTLEIEFPKAAVYRYLDVSAEQFRGLVEAPSIGTHFAAYIRGKFQWFKVDNETGHKAETTSTAASPKSREFFKTLCVREGYIGNSRSERYNASLEAVAGVMNARPQRGLPTVDEWIDSLTQAQVTAGIEWLKGAR
jgi:hypothetical protein